MLWTRVALLALAGAWGAVLANRGIAVFHDGLRPVVSERIAGRMPRRQAASIASGMSLGLIVGFGLPFSLISTVVLYHSLWLGTDLIGTCFPSPLSPANDRKSDRASGATSTLVLGER